VSDLSVVEDLYIVCPCEGVYIEDYVSLSDEANEAPVLVTPEVFWSWRYASVELTLHSCFPLR
jgi:hypothetical protein